MDCASTAAGTYDGLKSAGDADERLDTFGGVIRPHEGRAALYQTPSESLPRSASWATQPRIYSRIDIAITRTSPPFANMLCKQEAAILT